VNDHPQNVETLKENDVETRPSDDETLREILEANFDAPTRQKRRYDKSNTRNKRAWAYYRKVSDLLPEWWLEFQREQNPKTGRALYKTVRAFANAKTRNQADRAYLRGLIGREPNDPNQPWVGDWLRERASGFISPYMPAKLKELARAFKDKIANIEAVRSAAPYLIQELMRCTRMAEEIDEVFNGQMFNANSAPHDPDNIARFDAYQKMHGVVLEKKFAILKQWFNIHMIDPEGRGVTMQMVNQILKQNNVQANLQMGDGRVPSAPVIDPENSERDYMAFLMMRQLLHHEKAFNLPLPESIKPKELEAQVLQAREAHKAGKKVN
jgi:hypothetical protein